MGLHQELPVYKASYDLLLEIFEDTKGFNKEYKYTVGREPKERDDRITDIDLSSE